MTIFGNRDSSYGNAPLAEATDRPLDLAPPAASSRAFGAIDNRRIILRVHGDEQIVVGKAEGRENAVRIAREMVQHIEQAATNGEWPQIDERFIRPGAIVSIDVQREE
jgi:GGDEF domain-containing protein